MHGGKNEAAQPISNSNFKYALHFFAFIPCSHRLFVSTNSDHPCPRRDEFCLVILLSKGKTMPTFNFGALTELAEKSIAAERISMPVLQDALRQIDPTDEEIRLGGILITDPSAFAAYALVCVDCDDATPIYLYEALAQQLQNAYISILETRSKGKKGKSRIYLIKKTKDQVIRQYNIQSDTFFEL
jgi:hypothetical protein